MLSMLPIRRPLYLERMKVHAALSKLDFSPLRERYARTKRGKYLDFHRYVRRNLYICRELGLRDSPPLRILDIGCGSGLFLYCAKRYGHEAAGIDIEDGFYAEMAALLGVDRRIEAVQPFKPLSIEGPFDFITSIAIVFDRRLDPRGNCIGYWGAPEWRFLLSDLQHRLTPNGRVFLWLNSHGIDRDIYDDRLGAALRHGKLRDGKRRFLLDRAGLVRAIDALA